MIDKLVKHFAIQIFETRNNSQSINSLLKFLVLFFGLPFGSFSQLETKIDSLNFKAPYDLACDFAKNGNDSLAFVNLKMAIDLGAKGEDVLTDTDFNSLQKDSLNWKEIDDILNLQYLQRNPKITNPELAFQLWRLGIEDQRYRTLKKNNKAKISIQNFDEVQKKRIELLKQIIKTNGWPSYSQVGIEAADAMFFIFQHSDAKEMKKVLPTFIALAKIGEADIKKAAMMIDRYLSYTEGIQIYGTQAFKQIKKGEKPEDIPLKFYPIADAKNLVFRLKKLGMPNFEDTCKRLGVSLDTIDLDELNQLKIKRKWIKKGYLL